jgi:hypothetical protein
VGREGTEFVLRAVATASVLAVDEGSVDELIRRRLGEAAPPGTTILEDSLEIDHTDGSVDGDVIRFEGRASGRVAPRVDGDQIRARLAGLPVSEARAILEQIGTATVNVWPEFLAELPGDQSRIELDVLEPSTTE